MSGKTEKKTEENLQQTCEIYTFATKFITVFMRHEKNVSFSPRKGHLLFSGVWEICGCVFLFSIGCDARDSVFRRCPDGMSLSFLLCLGSRSIRSYMPFTAVSTLWLLMRER